MKVRAIRRLLGFCLFLAVTAASLEVGARLFFARSAGPRALLHGTPWHRNVTLPSLPRQDMQVHDDAREGYTKYFPREVKWGVDDRGRILDPDRDHLTSWVHLDREANQRVAEALAARILTLPEAASRGVDP